MKSVDEYCEVLGIDQSATPEQFKQAYRDLVKVWHPDRFSHDLRLQRKAEEKLKEINDAYQQLQSFFSNANRRGSSSTNASETKPAGSQRKPEEPRKPPPKPPTARTQQAKETSPRPDGDDNRRSVISTESNLFVASILSALLPGLGQIYNHEQKKGWVILACCAVLGLGAYRLAGFNAITAALALLLLWLSAIVDAYKVATSAGQAAEFYYAKSYVVAMLLLVGPLALPLLWKSPNFSSTERWIWTVIVVGAVLMFVATPYLLRSLIR